MIRLSAIRTFAPNDLITDADIAMYGREMTSPVSSIVSPCSNMMQGDSRLIDVLRQMGCEISEDQVGITVSRDANNPLQGIDIDMSEISDLVPTLAIVAMFAESPTRIRGVGFIRNKESDRIGDLAREMRGLGANV